MLIQLTGVIFFLCAFSGEASAQSLQLMEEQALQTTDFSFAERRPGDPRFIRLEMLNRAHKNDYRGAMRMAEALTLHPDWKAYADKRRRDLQLKGDASMPRLGQLFGILFSLVLGIFCLVGGRHLLRPSKEALMMGLGGVFLTLASYVLCREYSLFLGFTSLVFIVLTHAGVSSVHKLDPQARGRVLFGTLYFIGLSSVVGLLFIRVHPI